MAPQIATTLILAFLSINAPLAQAQSSTNQSIGTATTTTTRGAAATASVSLPSGITPATPEQQTPVALPDFPTTDEDAPPWVVVAVAARVAVDGSVPSWVPRAVLDPAKEVAEVVTPNLTLPNDALPYWFLTALSQHLAEPGASIPKWVPNDIIANAEEPAVKARPEISGTASLSPLPAACTNVGPPSAAGSRGTSSASSAASPAASGMAAFTRGEVSWIGIGSVIFAITVML